MAQSQQVFKLGATTVLTRNDAFADGYANGFVAYPQTAQQPLTDTMLYELIVTNILDVHAANEWNAGFILGIFEGLRKGRATDSALDASVVQCGAVTLRLNDWRFREGFLLGQEDRQADQAEQKTRPMFTARDLLSYVAHRDPETKRYFFTDEELNTLEETLGQLVGYLCTTLSPALQVNQQEEMVQTRTYMTEPLPHIIPQQV